MDIMQWILQFLQINESELVLSGFSLKLNLNLNSALLAAYFIVSVITKRAAFMAAFFMSCILFDMALFDQLMESQIYAITFAIYSYVIFCKGLTFLTKAACVMILALCVTIGYDAYFYGIGGKYGASDTFVYNNIQHIALYAHTIVISTLIPYGRIRDSFRRVINSVLPIARNSAYFIPI